MDQLDDSDEDNQAPGAQNQQYYDEDDGDANQRENKRKKKGGTKDGHGLDGLPITGVSNYPENRHLWGQEVDDIEFQTDEFGREQFHRMIELTYRDYYPHSYDPRPLKIEEYIRIVSKEQLETKYSVYLDDKGQNIITKKNMPWLDIGDLPDSYASDKAEAFQVYVVPASSQPNRLIVPYDSWNGYFDIREFQLNFDQY